MNIDLTDGLGLLGAVLLLWAYFAFQRDRLGIFSFSVLNAIGSFLILLNLCFHWNLSSFAVEVGWFLISLYGAIKHRDKSSV